MRKLLRHLAKFRAGRAGFCLLFIMATGGAGGLFPADAATHDAARWTSVNIPVEGEAGGWTLAPGSDISLLTAASDGTIYAYVSGLNYTLYKSTDGGRKWSHVGKVKDDIVGIAIPPGDTGPLYYATVSSVFRSSDGGITFARLPPVPGIDATANVEITALAAAPSAGSIVAVGTRDTDSREHGGVYILEATAGPGWIDTEAGRHDVDALAFSPDYARDLQLLAVMRDETDTRVSTRVGDTAWGAINGSVTLARNDTGGETPVEISIAASVTFPANYNAAGLTGSGVVFVGIDTGAGNGDVYKIRTVAPGILMATDLNIGREQGYSGVDISGLAVSGNSPATVLAGVNGSTATYTSHDGGDTWTRSRKGLIGSSVTSVLLDRNYAGSREMYAASSGEGSAFSVSRDSGATWNQLSLVDIAIDSIIDLAPSPAYTRDNTLFMLTYGSGHSLWRSQNSGESWERNFYADPSGGDRLNLVSLPGAYGDTCRTVFLAGESGGYPALFESTDNGQEFQQRFTRDPVSGTRFRIDAWAIAGPSEIFVASYDGSRGKVYRTHNSGFFYSEGAEAGGQALSSLSLSPFYERDRTLVAGSGNGGVYFSDDGGASFRPLPTDNAPPLSGSVTVAFDPLFEDNHMVYAASDTGGMYRCRVGSSTRWENIGATLPAGPFINRPAASQDRVLYAADSATGGGVQRCLNPASSSPAFEKISAGLDEGAVLTGVWLSGPRVWSIDTANKRVMTFLDTLTAPVSPATPEEGASGIGSLASHAVRNVTLDWAGTEGATGYQWQCSPDASFPATPAGFEGSATATSVRLPALEPGIAYYWRVRASSPWLGPWSEKRSFTTCLDTEPVNLHPQSPAPGASGVPVRPVFQWTAIIGAQAYELVVSPDNAFESPAITRTGEYALPSNIWQSDVILEKGNTYYWKVRAVSSGTRSTWSAAGLFTTEPAVVQVSGPAQETASPTPSLLAEPSPPPPAPSLTLTPLPTTPAPLQVVIIPPSPPQTTALLMPDLGAAPDMPGWIIYLVGGLLLVVILALTVLLAIILKIRHVM